MSPSTLRNLCCLLLVPLILSPAPTFAQEEEVKAALVEALRCIKMTPGDLSFRNDYLEVDPFRLKIVDKLMKDPLKMLPYSREVLGSLKESPDAVSMLKVAAAQLSILTSQKGIALSSRGRWEYQDTTEGLAYSLFGEKRKERIWRRRYRKFKKDLEALSPEVKQAMVAILQGSELLQRASEKSFEALSGAEYDSLRYGMTFLLSEDEFDEFKTVEELDSLEKLAEEWAEKVVHLAEKLNLCGAFSYAVAGVERIEEGISKFKEVSPRELPRLRRKNGFVFKAMTPRGLVMIGDYGSQNYCGEVLALVDLGGDDHYNLRFTRDRNVTVVVDLGGEDIYRLGKKNNYIYTGYSKELIPEPVGVCGHEFIYDQSGDDIYSGANFCLGAGLLGMGLLWDRKGNDSYFGDTFTMGAGCFGIGILRDDQGEDQYSAALFSQGFGFVGGFGALVDASGHDTYFTGNKYKDVLRYHDHYLTLSQGFAFGVRPLMSGGVGLLADFQGNDTYISDIFGQGSSYWWGFGGLIDQSGNDRYLSFQYAQGAATHLTVGALIDERGDDIYYSKGVSQGCGHDLAAGILYDFSGNDNYTAFDLSQAAGSANGLGILVDLEGADGYYVKSSRNTQGYGNPRRDYGSIGIFLDLEGEDHYHGGRGKDSSCWDYSKWGIGIDK